MSKLIKWKCEYTSEIACVKPFLEVKSLFTVAGVTNPVPPAATGMHLCVKV